MMLKVLSLLCLVALCHSLPSPDNKLSDLDQMLDNIFGPGAETVPSQHAYDDTREFDLKGYEKCSKSEEGPRVCVPYYLCDYNGLAKTTPSTEVSHIAEMPLDASCSSYLQVCCDEKYILKDFHPSAKGPANSEA